MVLRRLRGGLLSFVGVARFGLDARGVLLRFGEAARIVKTCGRAREWIILVWSVRVDRVA